MTEGEQTVDKLLTQRGIAHDTSYAFWVERVFIVICKHGEDWHSRTTHEGQCFLIYSRLEFAGLRVDEEPLRNNHVEVLHVLLERPLGMPVPVDIPGGAHTHARIRPFVDIFLCQS